MSSHLKTSGGGLIELDVGLLEFGELAAWCWTLNRSPARQEAMSGALHAREQSEERTSLRASCPSTGREGQTNEFPGHQYGSHRRELSGIILKGILPRRTAQRHEGTHVSLGG